MQKFNDEERIAVTLQLAATVKALVDGGLLVACGDYDVSNVSVYIHNARRSLDEVIKSIDAALLRLRSQ